MRLLALSDLHLTGPEDPFYAQVMEWIDTGAHAGDVLILAGDIFDLYVGDKSWFRERFANFHTLLERKAALGVKLHYIEGNHDFRLKKVFSRIPGLELHAESCVVELNGKRVYIAHGDLVDREDRGYLALRAALRSPAMTAFIDHAPDAWVSAIGERMSGGSHRFQNHRRIDPSREASRQERTRKVFRSFAAEKIGEGFDFVILGHCHLIDEFRVQVGERSGQYMNMGFPKSHGSGIVLEAPEWELSRKRIGSMYEKSREK